jgi:hypothetical protein
VAHLANPARTAASRLRGRLTLMSKIIMALVESPTMRVAVSVAVAVALGIAAGCLCTWLVWSLRLTVRLPVLSIAPFPVMILMYAAVATALVGRSEARIATLLIAVILGLIGTLLLGGVISEVIYCSYDRNGCINL